MKAYNMIFGLAAAALVTSTAQAQDVYTADLSVGVVAGTWRKTDLAGTGAVNLNSTHTEDGDGAANFTSTSTTGKASLQYAMTSPVLLSSLSSLSYDWFVDAASTTSGQQMPALRLFVSQGVGGASATLVFEPTYQGTAVKGSWETSNISLTSGKFWATTSSSNTVTDGIEGDIIANMKTLGDWVGLKSANSNLVVTGISFGIGSGWVGNFTGAVDHVTYNFTGGPSADFNFRAGAVPEPASWAMMIGGLGVVGAGMRRRARKVKFA